MAARPSVYEAARRFAAAYHRRADLVEEGRGWSPTIALCATDSGEAVAVRVVDGRVVAVVVGQADGDVVVRGDADLLCDILLLRRGASAPYLFGELLVSGPEADFMRLDYLVEALCPR